MLIEALNNLPEEVLEKVSPQSVRLQRWIKIPMLILLINSAFQSGVSVVFLKLTGELFVSRTVRDHIIMLFLLGFCMLITMLSTVHSLNLAMKHFD